MAGEERAEKTQAERMHALLGGAKTFRLRPATLLGLHEAAEHRFPLPVFDALMANLQASRKTMLFTLAVSPRTLTRRREEGVLSAEESDRALRVARVAATAEEVLGGRDAAVDWLQQPNRALGGRVPLDLLRTDAGAALVTDVLGRLEHGVLG